MNKTKKRVQVLSTLLVLLALLVGLGSASLLLMNAHAAGNQCSVPPPVGICGGGNPLTSGCYRDATSYDREPVINPTNRNTVTGYVDIRYSQSCRTAWGRVVSSVGTVNLLQVSIQINSGAQGKFAEGLAKKGIGDVNNDSNLMFSAILPVPRGTQTLLTIAFITSSPSTLVSASGASEVSLQSFA